MWKSWNSLLPHSTFYIFISYPPMRSLGSYPEKDMHGDSVWCLASLYLETVRDLCNNSMLITGTSVLVTWNMLGGCYHFCSYAPCGLVDIVSMISPNICWSSLLWMYYSISHGLVRVIIDLQHFNMGIISSCKYLWTKDTAWIFQFFPFTRERS